MRLSAFVLAARLERVAALANERLATMGDGRYQLRHTDAPAARGARSGLGLEVLDLWTGQARDTATLSGGESFMASLALALGLADAVREESGGFDLQTLFVDEGFGTLDDDTLEQVMGVLDGLREGGRAVGVVSHVAELRTRIPSQVVVRKTERGSSVRVTLVDEPGSAA
jgi:exonuclease SbcC